MPTECTRSDYANLSPTETENFRDLFRAADSINGRAFGKSRIGWCHRDARNIVTLQRSSAILRVRIDDAVMEASSRASSGRETSVVDELLAIVEREWKVLRRAQLAEQDREHEALTVWHVNEGGP